MIKLIYLSPTLHNGVPKNPGDTKFFDEQNLESLKELKGYFSPSNPLSNKVSIAPEHYQIYQLALSYHQLDELPSVVSPSSSDLLSPLEVEQVNPFIAESQVAVKRITKEPAVETKPQLTSSQTEEELPPSPPPLPPSVPETKEEIKSVEEEEEEEEDIEYSLLREVELRKVELESTHHTKIRNLAEQYGITYTNKDSAIKSILQREFQETAQALGQEELLND